MSEIELLYASNVISRRGGRPVQTLHWAVRVANRAYDKQVAVCWCGEDGHWQETAAAFAHVAGQEREVWRATVTVALAEDRALPGNVQFALACRQSGEVSWDSRGGRNYRLQADAGVVPAEGRVVQLTGFESLLAAGQTFLPVTAVVGESAAPARVFVRWSTDGWRTVRETDLERRLDYWDRAWQSNARNPNQYRCAVWSGRLRVGDRYRLQLAVGCDTPSGALWDDNGGANYEAARARLKVITLNLHCYQEPDQDAKFTRIAHAMDELEADVICLQEVGEPWNGGQGDWERNAARIIQSRLRHPYYLHTDWAHIGFDRYREGVAILSRYPLRSPESRYVGPSQDMHDIHARKAVMGQVQAPHIGLVNIFCAHLSWWENGFSDQFAALSQWAKARQTGRVVSTLLCGDFNVKAGSVGYRRVVEGSCFEDQWLKVANRTLFDQVYRRPVNDWPALLAHDSRIDYVWQQRDGGLKAVGGRVLFTDADYGRVSDHPGYYAEFEPY